MRPAAALLTLLLADPVAACGQGDALDAFVREHYGERIEFDVLRNGKPVGEHVTTFRATDDGLRVESRMQLDIRVLFVPVYRFEYASSARWCEGHLVELAATVSDNGDIVETRAARAGDALVVDHGGRTVRAAPDLIPTDHWNPRVLDDSRVLNTLTGNVNAVSIGACAQGSALVAAGAPAGARCYEYSGELQARVWYDAQARWVGLEFEGRDGSDIVYVCRNCAAAPGI